MPTPVANGLDLRNARIQNLGAPSASTDAVTKEYVDAAIRGLDWKQPVRVAAAGNVTLTAPGASIDGVTLAAGDRVLLMGQSDARQNGIWVFNGASSPMTRAVDADENAEVTAGLAVSVAQGTTNGNKTFVLITDDPIEVGVTELAFTPLGGSQTPYTAGNGLELSGQRFAVRAAPAGGVTVDSTGVRLDTALAVRKYVTSIGTGSHTAIVVTHGLGTTDVDVTLIEAATGAQWIPDITARDTNSVTLAFATAPAANSFRVRVEA